MSGYTIALPSFTPCIKVDAPITNIPTFISIFIFKFVFILSTLPPVPIIGSADSYFR